MTTLKALMRALSNESPLALFIVSVVGIERSVTQAASEIKPAPTRHGPLTSLAAFARFAQTYASGAIETDKAASAGSGIFTHG